MALEFKNPKEYIAEMIGTAILISIGCTAGGVAMIHGGGPMMIAAAFSLTFIGLVFCVGKVCDCHFNPIITLGMYINGRINTEDTIWYVLAQIVGGIIGGVFSLILVANVFYNSKVILYVSMSGRNGLLEPLYGVIVMDSIGAFIVEFLFALALCYITLKATETKKIDIKSGAIIGIALFGLIYIGSMMTLTAVNPAKSIGTAIAMIFSDVNGRFDPFVQLWLFILAPCLGAIAAGFAFLAIDSGELDFDKIIASLKKPKNDEGAPEGEDNQEETSEGEIAEGEVVEEAPAEEAEPIEEESPASEAPIEESQEEEAPVVAETEISEEQPDQKEKE